MSTPGDLPDPYVSDPVDLVEWRDWLGRACLVVQTVALVLIAVALIAD